MCCVLNYDISFHVDPVHSSGKIQQSCDRGAFRPGEEYRRHITGKPAIMRPMTRVCNFTSFFIQRHDLFRSESVQLAFHPNLQTLPIVIYSLYLLSLPKQISSTGIPAKPAALPIVICSPYSLSPQRLTYSSFHSKSPLAVFHR